MEISGITAVEESYDLLLFVWDKEGSWRCGVKWSYDRRRRLRLYLSCVVMISGCRRGGDVELSGITAAEESYD